MNMTPRQQVIAAINQQTPGRVPVEVRCTIDMQAEMVNCTGDPDYLSKYIEPVFTRVDLEQPGTSPKPGFYHDIFGVIWNRTLDKNIGIVENCVIIPDNIRTYQFPAPMPDDYLEKCRQVLAAADRQYRIPRLNLSLWERAWTLRGMENLMMDLIADPDFASDLFTRICDYNCAVLARALKHLPCDGIHFGDDWGTQTGLQMSPAIWRNLIKPHLKRMYAMVRDAGKYVSIHSCGKVQQLFDDLIEIGINSFNPFQPEAIDVDSAAREYKGRLCFWGGISTQVTLPFGSEEDVRSEVRHLLDLGRNGGFIVTPAHSIPPGTNPENIIAMLETMRDYA